MRNQSLFIEKMAALSLALILLVAGTVIRVQASPIQHLTPQQVEAVIEDTFAGLVTFDVPRVMNNFAADAVVEDPAGTPPMVGTQAITAYLQTFPTLFNQMKLYSLNMKVRGHEAAVSWRIRFTNKSGHVFFLEGIGFFRLNEEGKIELEREFFDLDYFLGEVQK